MGRVVMFLRDRAELLEESRFASDWKRDSEKLGPLDLVTKFRTIFERPVMVGYIALRSRMGCAIASSTIRSITSP